MSHAEYELNRRIAAPRQTVFRLVTDVRTLPRWLPQGVAVEPEGPNRLRGHGQAAGHDYAGEGLFDADAEQMRLEWGSRDDDGYAGWLQVYDSGPGASEANLHLSFREPSPFAHHGRVDDEVPRRMEEALDRLAALAETAASATGGPAQP